MNYMMVMLVMTIGAFYYNTFRWLIDSWMTNPYYSHGFVVPIVSGYIFWHMTSETKAVAKRQYPKGISLFIAGIMMQMLASISTIRFLSGISLIVTIFGLILYMFGWHFTKIVSFPILFLLFMIPIPLVDDMAVHAQTISVVMSSNIAGLIGMHVVREGQLLHISAGTFEIALECSGMKAIISLLALSTIYAFILKGGVLMKSVMVISAIPLAMMENVFRIVSILEIANVYGQEIAMDYFHYFSNIVSFIIVAVGLLIVGRCFGRLKFKNMF